MATAYATTSDVQARMARTMSESEITICAKLLDDAAVIIDTIAPNNTDNNAKLVVSCRMVIRALGDGAAAGVPTGATQGSQSALGYTQSWTISSGGSTGELYLGKLERQLLGVGNAVGAYSPTQELVPEVALPW